MFRIKDEPGVFPTPLFNPKIRGITLRTLKLCQKNIAPKVYAKMVPLTMENL